MYRPTILMFSVLFLALLLIGKSSLADKTGDWLGSVADDNTNLVVINGKIRSIDLYKMEIIIEGCSLLGNKPLKLSDETTYYKDSEEDTINSIRGGGQLSEDDKINYYDLEVGHTIKCNYEIIDGEFWALRVIRVSKHIQHILFNSSVLSVSKHW